LISFSSKNFCFSTSHEGLYSPNTFEVTLDTVEAAFVIADVAELAACRRNFVVSMPDTALPRPLLSDRFLDGALDGALELAVGELVPEPERLIPEPERLIPEPEGVLRWRITSLRHELGRHRDGLVRPQMGRLRRSLTTNPKRRGRSVSRTRTIGFSCARTVT
jgi:hypothetical protein